jgi:hypothetical protein
MHTYGLQVSSRILQRLAGAIATTSLLTTGAIAQSLPNTPANTPANTPTNTPISRSSGDRTIFENVTLSPNFANTSVRGISGGSNLSSELAGRTETVTGACAGFIDEQPDHTMQLTQAFNFLSLQVQSNADTTLVVRGPGGTWCNDDYTDKNPGIAGQWLSGTYQIWIGSYAENVYNPYVIRITEQR